MLEKIKKALLRLNADIANQNSDLIWSNVWKDTIKGIDWATNLERVSPGRAAVGYNYLYVMTRILDEFRPSNILDIGLGISSTLISGYASFNENVSHIIVEHDDEWIDFYKKKHNLCSRSQIVRLNLIKRVYNGASYYAYNGFPSIAKSIESGRFDLISIDGPFGSIDGVFSDASRRDVLSIIPENLSNSFVIVIDDYNRAGEKNTVKEIVEILHSRGIETYQGIYGGSSTVCVIASNDNRFFCSM